MLRVGIGYDIHRTSKTRRLVLGGVHIPAKKGLLGHSDADVLIHAICDAILGAMSHKGDIGDLFPDTDTRYKDIKSTILLKKVSTLVKKKGFKITNVDSIVILETPKLSSYKKKIAENIAKNLDLSSKFISVKAKTNEGLGEVGKNRAVVAYAIAALKKK